MYPVNGNFSSPAGSGSEVYFAMRESMTGIRLFLALLLAGSICLRCQVQLLPALAPALGQKASVEQLIAKARIALDRGDLEAARTDLEQVLSREGTNKQARLALTDVLRRLRRWKEAAAQAQFLMGQFPADTEPVYLMALIAMQRGDPLAARELATRCVARGDHRSEVYKVLALSAYMLRDTDEFEDDIRAVLSKNPRDAEAQYLLARYLFEVKRYSESLKTFQIVLQLQADHYKAHYYSGLLYGATREADLARAELMVSIEIVERKKIAYAWPFADLGRMLNDAGEPDKAIEWLSRGINNDATCPKVYYEYSRALFEKGAGAKVEEALLRAVRLDPGYTEAYYLLARYYKKSGENQAANQVFAKFRDLKAHPVPSPYGIPRQ